MEDPGGKARPKERRSAGLHSRLPHCAVNLPVLRQCLAGHSRPLGGDTCREGRALTWKSESWIS